MAHDIAIGYIGWGKQAVAGTPVTPNKFVRWKSQTGTPQMTHTVYRDGVNRDLGFAAKVAVFDGGDFTTYMYPDTAAQLLAHALTATDAVTPPIGAALSTTTTGATIAGATVIPVTSATGLVTGQAISVDTGPLQEFRTITSLAGLNITVPALTLAHASGVPFAGLQDPATHTLPSANQLPPYLTFERSSGNGMEIDRIVDGLIEELRITSQGGMEVNVYCKYVGRSTVAQASPATVTFETDRPVTYVDGVLTYTGLNVVSSDVTKWEIDIKNTFNREQVHGSPNPQLIFGTREISVNFTVLVPNNQLYRQIWFGSPTGTTVQNAPAFATSIAALWDILGVPDHSVQITVNNILMEQANPNFDVNGKSFLLDCRGRAILSGANPAVSVVAKNSILTAYTP